MDDTISNKQVQVNENFIGVQEKLKIIYEVCLLSDNPMIRTYVPPLKSKKYSIAENSNKKVFRGNKKNHSLLFVSIINSIKIFDDNGLLKSVTLDCCKSICGFTILDINDDTLHLLISSDSYQYYLKNINLTKSKKNQIEKTQNETFSLKQNEHVLHKYMLNHSINKNGKNSDSDDDGNKNKNENKSTYDKLIESKFDNIIHDDDFSKNKIIMKPIHSSDNTIEKKYPFLPYCEMMTFLPNTQRNFPRNTDETEGRFGEYSDSENCSPGSPIGIFGYHSSFGFQQLESAESYDENFDLILQKQKQKQKQKQEGSCDRNLDLAIPKPLVPFTCALLGYFDDFDASKCRTVLSLRGTYAKDLFVRKCINN